MHPWRTTKEYSRTRMPLQPHRHVEDIRRILLTPWHCINCNAHTRETLHEATCAKSFQVHKFKWTSTHEHWAHTAYHLCWKYSWALSSYRPILCKYIWVLNPYRMIFNQDWSLIAAMLRSLHKHADSEFMVVFKVVETLTNTNTTFIETYCLWLCSLSHTVCYTCLPCYKSNQACYSHACAFGHVHFVQPDCSLTVLKELTLL